MNLFAVASAIVVIFGSAATTASAQLLTVGPNEPPAPLVREAFASPYGRLLIAELGRALRADADPACLTSKGDRCRRAVVTRRGAADQTGNTGDRDRDGAG